MKKKLYTIINPKDLLGGRNILETQPGEVRYFLYEDEIPVRATGLDDGGLKVEKLEDKKWQIDNMIIASAIGGASLDEISQKEFLSLTN